MKAEPLDLKEFFVDLGHTIEALEERTLFITLKADGTPTKFWVQP